MISQLLSCFAFVATLFQHEGHSMTSGPHATWEYLLAGFSMAIVLWVFYLAIRMTLRPGEEEKDHIKRTILDDRWETPAKPSDQVEPTNRK